MSPCLRIRRMVKNRFRISRYRVTDAQMYSSYVNLLIRLSVSYTMYPQKIIALTAPIRALVVDPRGKNICTGQVS